MSDEERGFQRWDGRTVMRSCSYELPGGRTVMYDVVYPGVVEIAVELCERDILPALAKSIGDSK